MHLLLLIFADLGSHPVLSKSEVGHMKTSSQYFAARYYVARYFFAARYYIKYYAARYYAAKKVLIE